MIKLLDRKKVNPSMAVFTGTQTTEEVHLQHFRYADDKFLEDPDFTIEKLENLLLDEDMHWINLHGIHDTELVNRLGEKFDIHPLAIQDILDVNQRPKFQPYTNHWFFTLKSVLPTVNDEVVAEQISFILGPNYLVSFQEKKADYFEHIRQRIRQDLGVVRERGVDYLLFLMLEAILDNYFKTTNQIEEHVDSLQVGNAKDNLSPEVLSRVEGYKREVHKIKRTITPIKDFITIIEREDFERIHDKNVKYFYELKDLCMTLLDSCEQLEMVLESNVNLFFSLQGHRMNLVMKTLTVVATIFIPLTFIAGIYGMNFATMPELGWKYGYAGVWGIMLVVTAIMLVYFKKKDWF